MAEQERGVATAKLIQYLNEAYGTERRLETALEAHIAMTSTATYKKRLREHLSETKRHAREVERRIKRLGGSADIASVPGPDRLTEVAGAVVAGAQRAAALAKGPAHMLRGTGQEERELKNAKTEYADEAEEIATYHAIETLAEALGDRETASLAKSIRREEERMRSFIERQIPRLTKAVVRAEVPASERRGTGSTRSRSTRSTTAKRTGARATAKRTPARTTAKRAAAKTAANGSRGARAAAGTARKRASATARAATGRRSSGS